MMASESGFGISSGFGSGTALATLFVQSDASPVVEMFPEPAEEPVPAFLGCPYCLRSEFESQLEVAENGTQDDAGAALSDTEPDPEPMMPEDEGDIAGLVQDIARYSLSEDDELTVQTAGNEPAFSFGEQPAPTSAFSDPDNPLKVGIDTGLAIEGDPSDVAGRRIDFAFADAGDVFDNRGASQSADLDWTDYEKQQLRAALQTYADVLDIEINEVSNLADAELTFFAAEINGANSNGIFSSSGFLGFAFLPTGGSLAGNVIFNTDGFGWDRTPLDGSSFDGGLEQFGLGFQTILHELGHAFGLDHPFEGDGRTELFPGIVDSNNDGFTDNIFVDSGSFGLNQTVFTVMSDVTGWTEHPDGVARVFTFSDGPATRPEFGGYAGTPMALDLAVMQEAYGAKQDAAPGNDVYLIPDVQDTNMGYSTIWDTGGIDEIRYLGARDAVIDLRPATLQVEDGGGGFVSFVDSPARNDPSIGGFTIAAGVDIENASSDSGDDLLRGNVGHNILFSGEGQDTLRGDDGNDTLDGGLGNDSLEGGDGIDTLSFASLETEGSVPGFGVLVELAQQGVEQDTGMGLDTFSEFENVEGSDFNDLLQGDDAANTISGGGGRDLVVGGDGADVLYGGDEIDVVEGGDGVDILFGGTDGGGAIELDVFSYSLAQQELVFNFATSVTDFGAGTSSIVLEDTIAPDFEGVIGAFSFANTFDASALSEGVLILAGDKADSITGGSGNDDIIGGRGADIIYGGDGSDAFRSDAGDDDLFGGSGADIFQFDGRDGHDTIHDFEAGLDIIVFFNGEITQLEQLTLSTEDIDGDGGIDDVLISYSLPGEASSIAVLNATEAEVLAQILPSN